MVEDLPLRCTSFSLAGVLAVLRSANAAALRLRTDAGQPIRFRGSKRELVVGGNLSQKANGHKKRRHLSAAF